MKKIISFFCYAALAMAAVAFNSCNDDDEILNDDNSSVETKKHARLVASVSENLMEYGDLILTLEVDGTSKECRLSKGRTIDSLAYNIFLMFVEDLYTGKIPGREAEIPTFEYKKTPLAVTAKFELSESGKQKIANAKDGEMDEFCYDLKFGQCTKEGILFEAGLTDEFYAPDVEIVKFDSFIKRLETYFTREVK